MARKLSENEFDETFKAPMIDASDRDFPQINLKEDVEEILKVEPLGGVTREELEIHYVYVNSSEIYRHVLCFYGEPNSYLVLVINQPRNVLYGYHILDLNEKYDIKKI